MKGEQLALDLFPQSTFDEILVEKNISTLVIRLSNSLKKSWRIVFQRNGNKLVVVPKNLKNAPKDVKIALLEWAMLMKPQKNKRVGGYYKHKKMLEQRVWEYIRSQETYIPKKPPSFDFTTMGVAYDLKVLFDGLNHSFFNKQIQSFLRWGSYASKTSYQSHRIDHQGKKHNLITIAGIYNHKSVPKFAIEGVLFHEMLHIKIPPYKKDGRRVIHGKEFKSAERTFPGFEQWRSWEKNTLYYIYKKLKKTPIF